MAWKPAIIRLRKTPSHTSKLHKTKDLKDDPLDLSLWDSHSLNRILHEPDGLKVEFLSVSA